MPVNAPADDAGEPRNIANGHTHHTAGAPAACNSMIVQSSFTTKAFN